MSPPDVGSSLLLAGRWRARGAEHQRAAVDAAVTAWDAVGWPAGMTRYVALAGDDGESVVHLSWWSGSTAGPPAPLKDRWWAEVDRAAPGLERLAVQAFTRYGGLRMGDDAAGALVVVDVVSSDAGAARHWMDAMLALGRDEPPAAGMLSATFHLDTTGTRVLNLAEWTDASSHAALVTGPRSDAARDLIDDGAVRPVGFVRSAYWRRRAAPG